jgi:AmiR/NasT family two-component response regulator
VATTASRRQQLASNLSRALESRTVIEQAKGIVMAERRVDAQTAFEHLVDLSSTHHVKLRDIAHQIVEGVSYARRPGAPPA